MPLDHQSFVVPQAKLDQLLKFLLKAFAPIGLKEIHRASPSWVGLGDNYPFLWLRGASSTTYDEKTLTQILEEFHLCFSAQNREQVRAVHTTAIEAGGKCNGPPGFRTQFGPTYYSAYVRDPVVNVNWEVVTHVQEE